MYKNKTRYQGIIPPIITPLRADYSLDSDGLRRLIDFDIENGVSGIFVMGTSGEAMMTTRAVWLDVLECAIGHTGSRADVFCGVIDSSTERVIENIRAAEQVGAEIVVVTPAFYLQNRAQSEIVRHFEAVAASTKLSVVAYNIPEMTHANIAPETIRAIAQIDNVVAYKDSACNWEQFQRTLFLLEDRDIALFNGAEELCAAALVFGAQGCVPGLANFFPKMFVDMVTSARMGDIKTAYKLQKDCWAVRKMLSVGTHWMSAMKYVGHAMGFGDDVVSLPVEPLTEGQKREIDRIIQKYL